MPHPTTKLYLIVHLLESHQAFLKALSRIPPERLDEIALYDAWSIKDFIAHIGWWENSTAERIAALRLGETAEPPIGTDDINARVLEQYRDTPLDSVYAMEQSGFEALVAQVEALSDAQIFTPDALGNTQGDPLLRWIADNTYDHYAEHMGDVRAWMRLNGLD